MSWCTVRHKGGKQFFCIVFPFWKFRLFDYNAFELTLISGLMIIAVFVGLKWMKVSSWFLFSLFQRIIGIAACAWMVCWHALNQVWYDADGPAMSCVCFLSERRNCCWIKTCAQLTQNTTLLTLHWTNNEGWATPSMVRQCNAFLLFYKTSVIILHTSGLKNASGVVTTIEFTRY